VQKELNYSPGLLAACSSLASEISLLYEGWKGVDQLGDTPQRLARMYSEFCWPSKEINEELFKQFRSFDNGFDEMLVHGPFTVWVLCPHHLLPCELRTTIGYVPDGRVLGLSKFIRISEVMGKRPIMQEQYSVELADILMEKLQPKGVAVYVVGRHGCMVSRGVKQDAPVVTSVIRGCFEELPTRQEFFSIALTKGK